MRVSIKLGNAVPEDLPPNLLARLNAGLAAGGGSVESGYMRPGCVQLVLQVRSPQGRKGSCSCGQPVKRSYLAAAECMQRAVSF